MLACAKEKFPDQMRAPTLVGGESANLGYYCCPRLDVLNNRPSTLALHHTLFQISSRAADIIYHSCHKGHLGLFAQCESVCIGGKVSESVEEIIALQTNSGK